MAVKYATCHIRVTPRATMKPTRVRGAEAHMAIRAEVPVSASALGGQEITLHIVGKHAQEVIQLLAALHEPDAPKEAILARLKELGGNGDGSSLAPEPRQD